MRRFLLPALVGLVVAGPALGQFQGVLEFKVTGKEMNGTGKSWVSKKGTRGEMEMTATSARAQGHGAGTMKMTVIQRFAEPHKVYMVNDATKSYSVIDTEKMRGQAPKRDDETYTVKKLGTDAVAGYSCQNVLVTASSGNKFEVCAARELAMGDSGSWFAGMGRRQQSDSSMLKAMKEAGVEGAPVRMVVYEKGSTERQMTMELVKAEKRPVPDSVVEVPAGYKETDMMGAMLSPEAQKQLDEAMKNMTPDQRKAFEEMMKKRTGGQ